MEVNRKFEKEVTRTAPVYEYGECVRMKKTNGVRLWGKNLPRCWTIEVAMVRSVFPQDDYEFYFD